MAHCTKCGIEKPDSDFSKNPHKTNGLQSHCRACVSAQHKTKEGRAYRKIYRQSPAMREYDRAYNKLYRGYPAKKKRHCELNQKHLLKWPDRKYARQAVTKAIRQGVLIRPAVCSRCWLSRRTEAHHYRGYAKKNRLNVLWLCKQCHGG